MGGGSLDEVAVGKEEVGQGASSEKAVDGIAVRCEQPSGFCLPHQVQTGTPEPGQNNAEHGSASDQTLPVEGADGVIFKDAKASGPEESGDYGRESGYSAFNEGDVSRPEFKSSTTSRMDSIRKKKRASKKTPQWQRVFNLVTLLPDLHRAGRAFSSQEPSPEEIEADRLFESGEAVSTSGSMTSNVPVAKIVTRRRSLLDMITPGFTRQSAGSQPIEYFVHFNRFTGALQSAFEGDCLRAFKCYHIRLNYISYAYQEFRSGWCRTYHKAAAIFSETSKAGPLVRGGIRGIHTALWRRSTRCLCGSQHGVIKSTEDFVELLNYGERDDKPRFFTYVITDEGLFCTETGSALPRDLASKHAILCNGAYSVRCAGEFHFQCDEEGHWLVLDNESGTYAPTKEALELSAKLFRLNMETLGVETLDTQNPEEKARHLEYKEKVREKSKSVDEANPGRKTFRVRDSTRQPLTGQKGMPRAIKSSFAVAASASRRSLTAFRRLSARSSFGGARDVGQVTEPAPTNSRGAAVDGGDHVADAH